MFCMCKEDLCFWGVNRLKKDAPSHVDAGGEPKQKR